MDTVGAFDAKTNLSRLLDRVAKGEQITITRNGTPVAMLVPVAGEPRLSPQEITERFRKLRLSIPSGGPSIRELIQEGRRY
jgi:prevent-host-death family protein